MKFDHFNVLEVMGLKVVASTFAAMALPPYKM
jgi:Tfp pilus assembly major pilin PilA